MAYFSCWNLEGCYECFVLHTYMRFDIQVNDSKYEITYDASVEVPPLSRHWVDCLFKAI